MTSPLSLQFETGALSAALREVREAVERRNTIEICAAVLIEAGPDGATLTTTDLDVMIRRSLPCTPPAQPLRFAVDAMRLTDVVGTFAAGSQTLIEIGIDGAIVRSGRSRTRFATREASDFPIIPFQDPDATFTLPGRALAEAFGAVRHAISTEETRYYLNGIFMHVGKGDGLRFAATDGHRLARLITPCPAGAETLPDAIVPTKTVGLLAKLADSRGDVSLNIEINAKKMRVSAGDVVLTSKLVDGTFPDYDRIMPGASVCDALIDRDAIAAAAARLVVTTNDKVRAAKLSFDAERLTLSTSSQTHGEAADEVPCEFNGKAGFEVGFNLRYLRDALDALDADTVRFALIDSGAPTAITSAVPGGLTLVLMPMRV